MIQPSDFETNLEGLSFDTGNAAMRNLLASPKRSNLSSTSQQIDSSIACDGDADVSAQQGEKVDEKLSLF